uniref:protein O-GlcNAcase n=1 Tax=Scleropages formosus TaxID=113540 RepID=A0A8C9S993_SCLFO
HQFRVSTLIKGSIARKRDLNPETLSAEAAVLLLHSISGWALVPDTKHMTSSYPNRMEKWGLNTYLYGPKDDLKHRLLWREVYSHEEEAQLKALVSEAESRGLRFVYALSPGQDIVFSSSCDVTLLKRKLRQVADLGCKAFAVLFDDIDHSLCQADRDAFSSFAHAQVSVVNEIFRFLGEPSVFLFCPTEYCGSLCSPSVAKSPYLLTVGEDLLPGISVIWTGSKVISRELSAESLADVRAALQRPPLVWDNLHANDYDSRRVFLGPFKGRPPGLRAHIRGLLLNPNCEFEANYIPLHTLGAWFRRAFLRNDLVSDGPFRPDEASRGLTLGAIPADGRGAYCPEKMLSAALQDWLEELNQPLQPGAAVAPAPRVRVGLLLPSKVSAPAELGSSGARSKSRNSEGADNHCARKAPAEVPPGRRSPSGASLGPNLNLQKEEREQATDAASRGKEGGPKVGRQGKTPSVEDDGGRGREGKEGDRERNGPSGSARVKGQGRAPCGGKGPLSEQEVRLLVGLYFLPHEHGPAARRLLKDLTWLKSNSHYVSVNGKKSQPHKVEEWRLRASSFQAACEEIARLHGSVVNSVNRAFLYDLYPYVWDLRNTALVAKAFVTWLGCGTTAGADVLGVESEPWVFKGGLSGEVQMLLPIGANGELFSHPPPLFPTSRLYNIRPFQNRDKCDSAVSHPDLIGDRYVGASLALCPEYSFVLEDELGVCGCALGVLDARSFAKRYQASWLPAMRDKYRPRAHGGAASQEAAQLFQDELSDYPDSLLYHFPSRLCLDALPELVDCSVTRSLLTALLTALKANGSQGVFCEVLPTDHPRLEFLAKLGFLEIPRGETRLREALVLGRLL